VSLKSTAAVLLAKRDVRRMKKWASDPIRVQQRTFDTLSTKLKVTQYGRDLKLPNQLTMSDWAAAVPLATYEDLKPYVERVRSGERDVLYPGLPKYFCTTSGTTSGSKYIPMTEEGIKAQVQAARNALLAYMYQSGNKSFVDGKMIFLQGSPVTEKNNGIETGRLSGIVAHHVPNYLQKNRLPSWETNCISEWEAKIDAIVEETKDQDLRLVSGIPPWVQMYFEKLLAKTGKKTIREVFPNLSVFAHGGVNFDPYRSVFNNLIGGEIDSIETYPASEGFIAFQDDQDVEGMLLNLEGGIFYEFIPADELHNENPSRLTLGQVKMGVNYAIVLNTASGLWGYVIGDLVQFTSVSPYRIVVSGRIAHFISAFGEHVIAHEVESAIAETAAKHALTISEFHVAPLVKPENGKPRHQWFIEADDELSEAFASDLDAAVRSKNKYYDDLVKGNVLQRLEVVKAPRGTFNIYMESIGKLGGQNKLPRLANDRSIADQLKV